MKYGKILFFIILISSLLLLSLIAFSQDQQKPTRYMFVQTAQSGTFTKVEGKTDLYVLTLYGVSPQTIAFSDRPKRVVGQVPMEAFLKGLRFFKENPPNAAIEVLGAKEDQDLIVAELFEPKYDSEKHILTYKLRILKTPHHSYAIFNQRADKTLPSKFDAVTLYIDDCPDGTLHCCSKDNQKKSESCCYYKFGTCWNWYPIFGCFPCHKDYFKKCPEHCGSNCRYVCRGGIDY